jgi:hypothetical protein
MKLPESAVLVIMSFAIACVWLLALWGGLAAAAIGGIGWIFTARSRRR